MPITDIEMTRFNITLYDGINMVHKAIEKTIGGEIFVPKIPSYKIKDVAEAIGPNCEHEVIGIRPGEKLHEEMITVNDSHMTLDFGDYYAIFPTEEKLNYVLNNFKDTKELTKTSAIIQEKILVS